jgi:hypothetical protein
MCCCSMFDPAPVCADSMIFLQASDQLIVATLHNQIPLDFPHQVMVYLVDLTFQNIWFLYLEKCPCGKTNNVAMFQHSHIC